MDAGVMVYRMGISEEPVLALQYYDIVIVVAGVSRKGDDVSNLNGAGPGRGPCLGSIRERTSS